MIFSLQESPSGQFTVWRHGLDLKQDLVVLPQRSHHFTHLANCSNLVLEDHFPPQLLLGLGHFTLHLLYLFLLDVLQFLGRALSQDTVQH